MRLRLQVKYIQAINYRRGQIRYLKIRYLHGRCATRGSHHRDKSVSNVVATDGFFWTGRRQKDRESSHGSTRNCGKVVSDGYGQGIHSDNNAGRTTSDRGGVQGMTWRWDKNMYDLNRNRADLAVTACVCLRTCTRPR